MSILSEMARSLKGLIFPPRCLVCNEFLEEGEHCFCTLCRATAPLTGFSRQEHNPLREYLAAHLPIEQATALLYFHHASRWRQLIHNFKYHSHWYYAENMGYWLATEFARSNFFEGIDLIVPVPLHWRRKLNRGYNQTEHIAAGISRHTSIPYTFSAVKRRINNPPQMTTSYVGRWENSGEIFEVIDPKQLSGKHILLVDDVCTTGATLISLAKTINKACGDTVKISVATIAASRHMMQI